MRAARPGGASQGGQLPQTHGRAYNHSRCSDLPVYQRAKDRRGLLDYDDLIDKALALLGEDRAAWVHYKLDQGIDHVLIDEAQDTSPKQWEIIRLLTSEFFAGAGARAVNRTIFAVGDEKQSIFSFQGAAPREFDAMRRTFTTLCAGIGPDLQYVPFRHGADESSDVRRARLKRIEVRTDGAGRVRRLEPVASLAAGAGEHGHAGGSAQPEPPEPAGADAPAALDFFAPIRLGPANRSTTTSAAAIQLAAARPRSNSRSIRARGNRCWVMYQSADSDQTSTSRTNTRPPRSGRAPPGRLRERTTSTFAANAP